MFNNVKLRIDRIPGRDFFEDSAEGIMILLHFSLHNMVEIFMVCIVPIVEIGTRRVVTEDFITAYALVVVAVHVVEVDAAIGDYCELFRDGRNS